MLLSLGLVGYLYVQRANHHTKPPEPMKKDFVAGFDNIFVMNCSAGEAARMEYCECFLGEMKKAGAIQASMEDLEKHQLKMQQFRNTAAGAEAESSCATLIKKTEALD